VTATRWLGRRRIELDLCGSTSDEAARLARAGAEHGTVVTSTAQSAGRGRQGRTWHSAPGAGVYLSAVLRLVLAPRDVPGLTLAIGVAVCDAVRRTGVAAGLKWPNDIVVPGPDGPRKLGGILSETTSAAGRIDAIILGVGVNLGGELPAELADRATTLTAEGAVTDHAAFVGLLLGELEPWIDRYVAGGLAAVVPAWESRVEPAARVRATVDGAVVIGAPAGLDFDGALRLRDDTGRVHRVIAGDVEDVRLVTAR
jgi:BirA family transcriptional regulator, biotin operon repressor / biotin---[acetyl-CoA-carboxylase] ligase